MFSCYQYLVHCCRFHGHRLFIVLTGIHNYDNLRHRRNLTPVSNVCEASPRSLLWASYGLNELPEVAKCVFGFPFVLIGKSTMAFPRQNDARSLVCTTWY